MNKVFLVEDHDEVLKLWRRQGIKGLDLVHLDAHIDFGYFFAKPPEKLLKEAKSLKDLKARLEYSLNYLHYERDFNKQINIGNYIYPAIEEGIVNNFYWVIPGKSKEFKRSHKTIKRILRQIARFADNKRLSIEDDRNGIISTQCLGRKLIVCSLDNLPRLTEDVLLDIDIDFLVIDCILDAGNTKNVGKRKPWISLTELLNLLKERVDVPKVTTISYSVNGGWTPIEYKHFADELAFQLAPFKFKRRFEIKQRAARYFSLFDATGKKQYYDSAIKLNPTYRCMDNNYGPLYLSKRRFSLAQQEFKRILGVDKNNAGALLGLGEVALQKKNFNKAKKCYSCALRFTNGRLFNKIKGQTMFKLAKAEFALRNFKRAKGFLLKYKAINSLEPESYYLLGRVFEKEKEFTKAALFYKDAIRLGFGGIGELVRLLRISFHLKEKDDIIEFVIARYKELKKGFIRAKRLALKNLKKRKKIAGMLKIEKKMAILERRLMLCKRKRFYARIQIW